MRHTAPPVPAVPPRRSAWAAYAAAAWALLFALRGAYWALGGTVGLGTLSRGIREAAADRDPWLFAALWISVVLEIVAAAIALALVRPRRRIVPRRLPVVGGRSVPAWALLLLASGAGTVLAGHGALFVGFGAAAAIGGGPWTAELRWYTLFWGPWFVLGGGLFLAAAWAALRRSPDRRVGTAAGAVGVLGGLAATAMPFAVSALAARLP